MSKGFLLFANGEDYVKQAYLCALSIKANDNAYPVTIMSNDTIKASYKKIFDNVVEIPWVNKKDESRFSVLDRWKTYHVSPYEETVVLDVDTLVLQNIDEWWNFFNTYNLYYPSKVFNYRDKEVPANNFYRQAFVANSLPNLYTGIHYFKKNDTTKRFFTWLELVSNNWELFYGQFCERFYPKVPSMDLSTAIVTKILDIDDNVTNKRVDFIKFIHMKERIQEWDEPRNLWIDQVGVYLTNDCNLLIGNYKQSGIFHYVHKEFITDEIVSIFEGKVL